MISKNKQVVERFAANDSIPPLIFKGRVISVNHDTLSVDIYVPYTNKTYHNVCFGEGVLTKTYRSGGLPTLDSEVVVLSYSRTESPVIIACVQSRQAKQDASKFELILGGEYQLMSGGASYVKVDGAGNAYIGGANSASITETGDGSSLKYQKRDINITNFSKKELRTEAKDDIISVYGSVDIYEKSDLKKYSAEELLNNAELREQVISDAKRISAILFGGDTAGEAPTGRTLFDCLEMLINSAMHLTDFENEFESYKARSGLATIKHSGNRLNIETFGEENFTIKLLDENGEVITGLILGTDGGQIIGTWKQ